MGRPGLAFAAVAAVAAQVTSSARVASAIAYTALAVFYVLRAVGDSASSAALSWPTWLSPIGWEQQIRAYAGNRWWVLLITTGFTVAVAASSYFLVAHRDLDSGLVADRPGQCLPPFVRETAG